MSLLAVAPGPLATIQDLGRFGFRRFGVPVSGPFDRLSATVANALLGNPIEAAVLELTGFGGVYQAEHDLAIALAGATMSVSVHRAGGMRRELRIPCATNLRAGDHLRIGASPDRAGFRSYLAARGGWTMPIRLGSRSDERPLATGDRLLAVSSSTGEIRTETGRIRASETPIRYLDGPQVSRLDSGTLEGPLFRIGTESDRVGIRLLGATLAVESPSDRLSIPVAPGTIQIAGGQPIILGPACGTMGGYPYVGQVISADLDRLGQSRPGTSLSFLRVDVHEARDLDRVHRVLIAETWLRLSVACRSL